MCQKFDVSWNMVFLCFALHCWRRWCIISNPILQTEAKLNRMKRKYGRTDVVIIYIWFGGRNKKPIEIKVSSSILKYPSSPVVSRYSHLLLTMSNLFTIYYLFFSFLFYCCCWLAAKVTLMTLQTLENNRQNSYNSSLNNWRAPSELHEPNWIDWMDGWKEQRGLCG